MNNIFEKYNGKVLSHFEVRRIVEFYINFDFKCDIKNCIFENLVKKANHTATPRKLAEILEVEEQEIIEAVKNNKIIGYFSSFGSGEMKIITGTVLNHFYKI